MMKRTFSYLLMACLGFLSLSCSGEDEPKYEPPKPPEPVGEVIGTAEVWTTTGTKAKLLTKDENVDIFDVTDTEHPSITVDASKKFQEIEGFGAALTGSSAYLINTLSVAQKNELLMNLFDPEVGIGMSYLRMSIGASDFSLLDYTYNDVPQGEEDPDLSEFSIAQDKKHIIPVFQEILKITPDLGIMGSPWSAPAWMKTSQSLHGGKLKPEWYDAYASYFVKYIENYSDYGIDITAITPQNEPLHEAGYPTMLMEASEQATFIKRSLGPAFEAAELETRIIAYDHNFDKSQYPLDILSDEEAYPYVDGIAFHAYAGNVTAMNQVHESFPDKGLYFTEISGGEWATDFSENLVWNLKNILIGTLENWSKTVLFWNLALDEDFGPTNNGCQNCRGVVTIKGTGTIEKNVEYYAIGHFSKFIRPGARRISSTDFAGNTGLHSVAFQNPDQSKVVVVLNESDSTKPYSIVIGAASLTNNIPANAVQTIVWK